METNKKFGVVGAGLVGTLFEKVPGYEVVHRNEWEPVRWEGLVNTAAITGRPACEETHFAHVLSANVRLPMKMFEACEKGPNRYDTLAKLEMAGEFPSFPPYENRRDSIPFITFSTSEVYRAPDGIDAAVTEESPVCPTNSYNASKILMEAMLPHDRCFIFRIPRVIAGTEHPNDFEQKVQEWRVCEDLSESVIYPWTIIKAVDRALTEPDMPRGIYNLASETVHLPTYIEEHYGWEGEVVEPWSLGFCPAVIFDTSKAESVGLI